MATLQEYLNSIKRAKDISDVNNILIAVGIDKQINLKEYKQISEYCTGSITFFIRAQGVINEHKEVHENTSNNCQATTTWKSFKDDGTRNGTLQETIDLLIESDYHVDNVIPVTQYQKVGMTGIYTTEAIILISK